MRVLIPNCITPLILLILSISPINGGRYRSRYVHSHGARSGARIAYHLAPFVKTFNLFNLFNIFRGSTAELVDENGDIKPSELYSETHLKTTDPPHQGQQNKKYINREDVYFQISEPENLRYTFKARSSRIGVPFTQTFTNYALVLAEPRDSCSSIINKLEINNNIALVERGGCSFLEKCIEIERSGGIGLIVYDYDRHNDENYIEMIDDNTSRNCSIPAVSLLGKDGHMIVQALLVLKLSRAVITIPVNTAVDKDSNPPWMNW